MALGDVLHGSRVDCGDALRQLREVIESEVVDERIGEAARAWPDVSNCPGSERTSESFDNASSSAVSGTAAMRSTSLKISLTAAPVTSVRTPV